MANINPQQLPYDFCMLQVGDKPLDSIQIFYMLLCINVAATTATCCRSQRVKIFSPCIQKEGRGKEGTEKIQFTQRSIYETSQNCKNVNV